MFVFFFYGFVVVGKFMIVCFLVKCLGLWFFYNYLMVDLSMVFFDFGMRGFVEL